MSSQLHPPNERACMHRSQALSCTIAEAAWKVASGPAGGGNAARKNAARSQDALLRKTTYLPLRLCVGASTKAEPKTTMKSTNRTIANTRAVKHRLPIRPCAE